MFEFHYLCVCHKFERALFEARTEEELASVSKKYEFSLMLRLIGSHQALRLERIRSNLEAHFNEIERKISEDPDFEYSVGVSDEEITSPSIDVVGMVHTDGYEWIKHEGVNWYRVPNSNADWIKWQ